DPPHLHRLSHSGRTAGEGLCRQSQEHPSDTLDEHSKPRSLMPPSAHPLQLGLAPMDLADWLKPEPGDAALLAERTRIIAAHEPEVIGFLPAADAAVRELAALLAVEATS